MPDSDLVLLTTCGDAGEAGALRSRLEAEGIPCVAQGEHHHALLGSIAGGVIEVRVLVPEAALARARELISGADAGALPEDGDVAGGDPHTPCGEHGQPSVGTCSRCGAFVCEACVGGATSDLLCSSCEARLSQEYVPKHQTARRVFAWLLLGAMALPILLALLFR